MGLSWAFHLAHEAHKCLARRTVPGAALIEDRRPAPKMGLGSMVSSMLIYADNANHCGVSRAQVGKEQEKMIAAWAGHS